jgi:hypothetical protein
MEQERDKDHQQTLAHSIFSYNFVFLAPSLLGRPGAGLSIELRGSHRAGSRNQV